MRVSPAIAFLFFALCAPNLAAQQNAPAPIIISGTYAAGATLVQPHETVQIKEELELSLSAMAGYLAAEPPGYDFVIKTADRLLSLGVDDPRLYTALALAYEGKSLCGDAIYNASQAIARRPSDVEALTVRAHCYYKRNDLLRAREDIETAMQLNPRYERGRAVQELIASDGSIVKKPKARVRPAGALPSWFFVYVVCVIIVLFAFLMLRYRGLVRGAIDDGGRPLKEVNIKEQYNFLRQIGEGGMGKVYEAYDNVLKRKVAVKRIKPELLKSAYVREQFLAEARMVAILRHPCIVEIYTVLETASSLYLVFEYVEGQTLETRLDIDGYMSYEDAKEVFSTVCKGLSYAHSHNIVHCDLKPGNIMISDSGIAKVMDFGVARQMKDASDTNSRTVAGTPAYMSPEQQKGYMSKQSDIYSLAACLYESLVGSVPWSVAGFDLATKKIVPPSALVSGVPKVVDELIAKCLNEDPAKRVQTVEEFWDILDNA